LTKSMKPAALLVFLTDIHAIGLDIAQGLVLTTAWYWDLDDRTRAFAKKFYDKVKREPTFPQAAFYSATLTYLTAVKAAGTTDADKVMDELHKMTINDAFVQNATIRPDGVLLHDMYVMQVKSPSESKGEWDYYKLVKTMSGEEAFGKLADSACPLVKK
ncbi:MAG TPA: ABC transporter substrate-binding protein, partial [Roseiarcus sp.]|nr:ABC transporter substrate-binding protein [Roseiarcus sp.]